MQMLQLQVSTKMTSCLSTWCGNHDMRSSTAVSADRCNVRYASLWLPRNTTLLLFAQNPHLTTFAKPYVSARTALIVGSEKNAHHKRTNSSVCWKHQTISSPMHASPLQSRTMLGVKIGDDVLLVLPTGLSTPSTSSP